MDSRSPAPPVALDALLQDPTVDHDARERALGIGAILRDLEVSPEIVMAGMAGALARAGQLDETTLPQRVGKDAADLAREVLKLPDLESLGGRPAGEASGSQAEKLRRLILAVIQDGRVVVIRLAERLHDLRTAKHTPLSRQQALAQSTREIYAPLANRLGIWQLKWELEDLAFRFLEPDSYMQVARWLSERRSERESYLARVVALLSERLREEGISAQVEGRPKHIYSIWRKMQRKRLDFDRLYDVHAVRVRVADVPACYAALGVVHGMWRHVPREFDDYIANPKDNLYRSLHTAVIGPESRPLEIQIRTHEMHRHAEFGIASHWRYKEGMHFDPTLETRIGWMRQILSPGGSDADFIDRFRSEVVEERAYVLTPAGDILDLPNGATALDFAYYVHTDIGHRCRGARVNGKLVPLSHVLASGDQVEIITGRTVEPSRDWLNLQAGYLMTARARDKVRAFFRQQDREINIGYGRDALDRELNRLGLQDFRHDRLLKHFRFETLDDLFCAMGAGDVTTAQIAGALQRELAPGAVRARPRTPKNTSSRSAARSAVVLPGLTGDFLVTFARCCRPVPGERIAGYVTRVQGVTIHHQDCANLLRLASRAPERTLEVHWRSEESRSHPVDILVEAEDRRGLLNDISAVFADERLRLMALDARASEETGLTRMKITVAVPGLAELSRLLNRLLQLPGVYRAARTTAGV